MATKQLSCVLELEPEDTYRLATLCGPFDQHIKQIAQHFSIEIKAHSHTFKLSGRADSVQKAARLLKDLYRDTAAHAHLTPEHIRLAIVSNRESQPALEAASPTKKKPVMPKMITTKQSTVKPQGANQNAYVEAIENHSITFGIGPAGTGKTHLAVACAVAAFERQAVARILLVRPAVEAGEKLGFLPGDLAQKIDPYLQPLYDALFEMMGADKVCKLIDRHLIEVAPLAYMRGRTLSNAFVILDEGQNTSIAQMKMFLTRIGFGSTVVITGDVTQVDLPRGQVSGLAHAAQVLSGISGIRFVHFSARDTMRHPLVQRIVSAYAQSESAPLRSLPVESDTSSGA